MRCSNCHSDNLEHRRFCAQCGSRLPLACSVCGFANEPLARFCGGCGRALQQPGEGGGEAATGSASSSVATIPGRAAEPERRQLTVMFCDMVSSSSLAERLDPEDLRELMQSFQQTIAAVVLHYEGFVAKYMGDGVLVYFGYPTAHEDDAERALRAGLDITRRVPAIELAALEAVGRRLAVRIGVATGLVVVGDLIGEGASEEKAVIGNAPNVAARLQHLARPNTVVVAEDTAGLVGGRFVLQSLGAQQLHGISLPVHSFEVLATDERATRFEISHGAGLLVPMVGRAAEMATLEARWARARAGQGGALLVVGEAGIGKSRLVESLRESVLRDGGRCLSLQCSPYYTHTAFYPFVRHLRHCAGIDEQDPAAEARQKLYRLLESDPAGTQQDLSLLADLLGVAELDASNPDAIGPQRRRVLMLEALTRRLTCPGGEGPLLLVVEDLQWSDPSTIDLCASLADTLGTRAVLLVISSRDALPEDWPGDSRPDQLRLQHLDGAAVRQIIAHAVGGKRLPNQLVKTIVAKTDGVPLFVEELVKTVMVSDLVDETDDAYVLAGALPALSIPATLQDSLLARLTRRAPLKEVAQTAAVIGREFSLDLLARVSPHPTETLAKALEQLVEAGVIQVVGAETSRHYQFRHALVQDATYQSLLRRHRQQLHAAIAEAMVAHCPAGGDSQPELLAHHYTEAGLMPPAVAHWARAGRNSLAASANAEAVGHLSNALQCLERLPASQARDQSEVDLRLALGTAYRAVRGYTATEAIAHFDRAKVLAEDLGQTDKLADAQRGICAAQYIGGQLPAALDQAIQIRTLGQHRGSRRLTMLGCWMAGGVQLWMGEFAPAREQLERAQALYDPADHPAQGLSAQTDPGLSVQIHLAWDLWFLGRYRDSLTLSSRAVTTARTLRQPFALSQALLWSAYGRLCLGQTVELEPVLNEMVSINRDHDFSYFASCTGLLYAQIDFYRDRLASGRVRLDRALADFDRLGAGVGLPWALTLPIAAYIRANQLDQARALLDRASDAQDRQRERQWQAELLRLDGLLHLAAGAADIAEPRLVQALTVARRQQALALELRVTTSLAELRRSQRRQADAQALLAPVVARFAGEPASADLVRARRLLAAG